MVIDIARISLEFMSREQALEKITASLNPFQRIRSATSERVCRPYDHQKLWALIEEEIDPKTFGPDDRSHYLPV